MKALISSAHILLKQIRRDNLTALFFVLPVALALLLRFGIPALNALLTGKYDTTISLVEYYSLFDLIIILITPYFFGFGASLIILEEMDEHILPSYYVSPLGKKGYLVSRLLIPIALSLIITFLLISVLHLSTQGIVMRLVLSLLAVLFCLIPFLLIISYAKNKVEGMAWAKFSTTLSLGFAIPYFISDWVQYLFGFLPSFWISKLVISANYIYVIPAMVCSAIWIGLLYQVFDRKITR